MNTPSLESSSIEYNSTRYADCYPLGKLASFNHGPLAKGPINREAIRKLIPELNEQAAKETEAIRFEAKRIENTLVGGSCSAIALKIAGLAVDLVAS